MKKAKVTLRDIANATGLSTSTVSLVLNGKGFKIPESTRQRIRDAVIQLNYQPNLAARSLATGKTQTIGVIVPDISNTFFAEMVHHLQLALSQYSYDIILCSSEEKMSNDIKYIRLLSARNVDGLILTLSGESLEKKNRQQILSVLAETAVPHIFLDRYLDADSHVVSADNRGSGSTVARMLLENGHTQIGVITGPISLNSSKNRLAGFRKALSEQGVTLPDNRIYHGHYNVDSGIQGARQLLQDPSITAIFAFNDLQAFGVMTYARQEGIRIPQDISLAGFDDTFFCSMAEPKLTSIKQPVREMAQEASEMIVDLLHGTEHRKSVKLKTRLIERDSVRRI